MNHADKNIIILGMPGVGKTTVGKRAAALLGREFFDSDEMIMLKTGKSCAEIINESGEEYFRAVERDVVGALTGKTGAVIALGGGAPKFCGDLIEKNAIRIWLIRPLEQIAEQLDSASRPLSKSYKDLKYLWDEREAIYSQNTDYIIDNNSSEKAASEISGIVNRTRKPRLMFLNGPNLNMLGIREPGVYGSRTLHDLELYINAACHELGADSWYFQSNHEGEIIESIHQCLHRMDGIIINPGAFTHYSYAIHDALKGVSHKVPAAEVHISDINAREQWRAISVTKAACIAQISGHGFDGYIEAARLLLDEIKKNEKS